MVDEVEQRDQANREAFAKRDFELKELLKGQAIIKQQQHKQELNVIRAQDRATRSQPAWDKVAHWGNELNRGSMEAYMEYITSLMKLLQAFKDVNAAVHISVDEVLIGFLVDQAESLVTQVGELTGLIAEEIPKIEYKIALEADGRMRQGQIFYDGQEISEIFGTEKAQDLNNKFDEGFIAWAKTQNYDLDNGVFIHQETREPLTPEVLKDSSKTNSLANFYAGRFEVAPQLTYKAST